MATQKATALRSFTRQEQLDYLRGLAAFMVLLNHVRGAFYVGGERVLASDPSLLNYVSSAVLQVTSFGPEAVILFFVLSGYAMANSVSLSTDTKRFYFKRVLRIWPPYVAACLLAAAVGDYAGMGFNLLPTLFYVQPGRSQLTPQFWSLPYEVAFYALCPFILASPKRIRALFAFSFVALSTTLIARGPIINPWQIFALNFLGNELFLFAAGAMAFLYVQHIPALSSAKLMTAVCLALAIAWITKRWLGELNAISMVAVAATSVLAIVNVKVVPRFNFGFFSYSLYLFHYALIVLVASVLVSFGIVAREIINPVAWLPIAALVGITCWALYAVTERISNEWVSRLRTRPNVPPRS